MAEEQGKRKRGRPRFHAKSKSQVKRENVQQGKPMMEGIHPGSLREPVKPKRINTQWDSTQNKYPEGEKKRGWGGMRRMGPGRGSAQEAQRQESPTEVPHPPRDHLPALGTGPVEVSRHDPRPWHLQPPR